MRFTPSNPRYFSYSYTGSVISSHRYRDRFTVAGFGFCMFERAWSLMGMENILMNMLLCPDELDALFDRICDYSSP